MYAMSTINESVDTMEPDTIIMIIVVLCRSVVIKYYPVHGDMAPYWCSDERKCSKQQECLCLANE